MKRSRLLLLLALTALSLAGCTKTPAKINPAIAAMQAGPATYVAKQTVLMDQTLTLAHHISLNPDCTVNGYQTYRIINAPAHGTVTVNKRLGYTFFPEKNSRFACNKKKHMGMFVDYTPDEGYTGKDAVTLESISVHGSDAIVTIFLTVK